MCHSFSLIVCFLSILSFVGITDAKLSLPELLADAWQLHDGHVLCPLEHARAALNSGSTSAKVFSDSFTSALCGHLRSNHSFVKDVKQDRRRKSVSDATVKAACKEKNRLKNVARRRDSNPRDRRVFYEATRSHCRLKRIHKQAQREKDAMFQKQSSWQNFYNYAKEAVAGTIGGEGDSPQFTVEVGNDTIPKSIRFQSGSSRAH
jgi:hypothetical protein